MMCHLLYFGHNFNPATFYYCYDSEDKRAETIIVEIHNTPWGKVFSHVPDETKNEGTREQKRFRFPKEFHVSPFIAMTMNYDWTFSEPGETLNVHMIDFDKGEKFFEADLSLSRREMTGPNLARMLVKYPLMTVKVITAIYWQALKLWVKGATLYTHPARRSKEEA